MYRYCRRVQLKSLLGSEFAYESAEFCSEAETKEEVVKEVEDWIAEWKNNKLAEIARLKQEENNKEPF